MTRFALNGASSLVRHSITYLVITVLCASHLCIASDDTQKWTVVVRKKGSESARKAVPKSTTLHNEIEAVSSKGSSARSRVDLVTYAPATRVESELEQIEFRGKWVVYSSRKAIDDSWVLTYRRTEESDRLLRQKIQLFAEDSK